MCVLTGLGYSNASLVVFKFAPFPMSGEDKGHSNLRGASHPSMNAYHDPIEEMLKGSVGQRPATFSPMRTRGSFPAQGMLSLFSQLASSLLDDGDMHSSIARKPRPHHNPSSLATLQRPMPKTIVGTQVQQVTQRGSTEVLRTTFYSDGSQQVENQKYENFNDDDDNATPPRDDASTPKQISGDETEDKLDDDLDSAVPEEGNMNYGKMGGLTREDALEILNEDGQHFTYNETAHLWSTNAEPAEERSENSNEQLTDKSEWVTPILGAGVAVVGLFAITAALVVKKRQAQLQLQKESEWQQASNYRAMLI